ncbi:PEP-CTERM sorting domain-containing protein [Roseateles sp.]|uniref:PEP-CTERM sorting domain-containing protein n=1 Tax=Roseateles sp. TaxID=1971397 RepID=UPI002E0656EA|nr:PEP-CTERM sorting domain-containing protein [Roseateles sp.]
MKSTVGRSSALFFSAICLSLMLGAASGARAGVISASPFFDVYGVGSNEWTVTTRTSTVLSEGSGFIDLILTPTEVGQIDIGIGGGNWRIANLMLVLKGPQTGLSQDGRIATETLDGAATVITATASYAKPRDAQLATSYGQNNLNAMTWIQGVFYGGRNLGAILADGEVANSLKRRVSVTTPADVFEYGLSGSIIGANYLVPSSDPACASVLCMPAARAVATLESVDLRFAVTTTFAAPVPEPTLASLMLAGLAALCAFVSLRRRRG